MRIFQNPFYILGATLRDNRRKIMELAQEKSLDLDFVVITEARLLLITPRKRIAAEISWFPGVSNKKVLEILETLKNGTFDSVTTASLPALASFNLIIEFLSNLSKVSIKNLTDLLYTLAVSFENIDTEKLIRILNEDRSVAGISEITDFHSVDMELQAHKDFGVRQIREVLKKTSQKQLTAIMLALVNKATRNNQRLALIDAFIDNIYAMEIQKESQKQEESINKQAENIKTTLAKKTCSASLSTLVKNFIRELSNFNEIMQPIQISMQQRGLEHDMSCKIAYTARSVAISLGNMAGKLKLSEKLMRKVKELFAEIGSIEERISQDLKVLEIIKNQNRKRNVKDLLAKSFSWLFLSFVASLFAYAKSCSKSSIMKTECLSWGFFWKYYAVFFVIGLFVVFAKWLLKK
ncbi:MAG: hypothetical protein LBC11_02290 [Puniceicoccales bacterium]|jgi:hypothetical protein|nr:hypothetical protein [Puniceicoccales bacterium]